MAQRYVLEGSDPDVVESALEDFERLRLERRRIGSHEGTDFDHGFDQ